MCIRDSYEVYETDSHVNLVLELMKGGHILEKVSQKGFYTEADASILMGKLLGALDHLHSRNIVHRDIKLDNLILIDSNDDTNVKIADFGLACKMNSEFYARRCGTPGYTAPEILNKKPYDTKVDIFSAGVVLFIMLVGYLPFEASTCSELLKKNQECDIDLSFPDEKTRPSDSGAYSYIQLSQLYYSIILQQLICSATCLRRIQPNAIQRNRCQSIHGSSRRRRMLRTESAKA
eukprot:TRINITY_DN5061_c0_g1_i7.p1 TRINITY_DN5061_c0_g1~~TRINITY_DN5061_c0_g1_i7.p1  ORF type:complete len:254 (-),score=51.92 TRINITY_DN5061_c0_g1_i7:541-1242(-)